MDVLQRRGQHSQALNNLGRELTAAITLDQVFETIIRNVGEMFDREIVILLPENGHPAVKASTPGFTLGESELAVADWALSMVKRRGGTNTLPAAAIRYVLLLTSRERLGYLEPNHRIRRTIFFGDQRVLMEGVVNLAAIAIERASFGEKAAQAKHCATPRNYKLRCSIPFRMSCVHLSLPSLGFYPVWRNRKCAARTQFDPATRLELIQSASRQAIRFNHLVENLLDMSRLESGSMRLNRQMMDIQDC